jgi:hypothetical protein
MRGRLVVAYLAREFHTKFRLRAKVVRVTHALSVHPNLLLPG